MLCDVVFGRTGPRSMPLAMLTMKKELHGFLFQCMHVVLFLQLWCSTWRPAGAPLLSNLDKHDKTQLLAKFQKVQSHLKFWLCCHRLARTEGTLAQPIPVTQAISSLHISLWICEADREARYMGAESDSHSLLVLVARTRGVTRLPLSHQSTCSAGYEHALVYCKARSVVLRHPVIARLR